MKIWRDLIILIGVFALIWAIFTFYPLIDKDTDFNISVEKETEIGQHLVDALLMENRDTINNPIINQYIDSTFHILKTNYSSELKFNYNFIVLKNEQVNAFALPGGNIVLHSELFNFCDSPEELAGIMAHEIGHIENRHLISRLLKKLGIAILLSGDATVLNEVSNTAISTVFDRKQETEADNYAMRMMQDASISPRILARFFQKLENEGLSYNKNLTLLMTHPHNDDRLKEVLSFEMDSTFVEEKLELNLAKIKEELKKY